MSLFNAKLPSLKDKHRAFLEAEELKEKQLALPAKKTKVVKRIIRKKKV